jgi:ERCC4-type nuclease
LNRPEIDKFVDSREPEPIRNKLLQYGWRQTQLQTGDYFFFSHDMKRVAIERKEVNDFLSSIGDKLTRQLDEMQDAYDISILMLEGSWATINPAMNIVGQHGVSYNTWEMVWNYIHRKELKHVILEITVNSGHTIQRVGELYALYQKAYSLSGKSNDWTDDRILSFPSGCRGKTAMNVLAMFKSLWAVSNAEVNDFLQVENVGKKKAELIYNHFHKGLESENERIIDPSTGEIIENGQLGMSV